MRHVLILTDRSDFTSALTRGEPLPYGVSILPAEQTWISEGAERTVELRVNLRVISETAFALWVLRRLRSILGDHGIEIGGTRYPLEMPRAIDLIADALVNSRRSRERMAA